MAVNILLSYAYFGTKDLKHIRSQFPCGRLMIDSGAFTAFTLGKAISLAEYSEFLTTFTGSYTHAVTLDVIGDPAATAHNTTALHRAGLPVLPVFTIGGTLAEFDAMVRDTRYVCVGGTVGMNIDHQTRRLAMLQRRARGLGGGIHALGVGNRAALATIRPYSADSSTVASMFRFGRVCCWNTTTRRVEGASLTDRPAMVRLAPHLARHGIDAAALHRVGRLPKGEERRDLMYRMSHAFAVLDEVLVAENQAPVPEGTRDTPGTHLYSAVPADPLLPGVLRLDREIHCGRGEAVWSPYRTSHVCTPVGAPS